MIEHRGADRAAIAAPLLSTCRDPPGRARSARLCAPRRLAHAGLGPSASATPRRHSWLCRCAAASATRGLRLRLTTSTPPQHSMQSASGSPIPGAETYTAHSIAIPAVQSNEVYPTPCTTVTSTSFGLASDKRYSLARAPVQPHLL